MLTRWQWSVAIMCTLAVLIGCSNGDPATEEPAGLAASCYHDWTAYFLQPAEDVLRPVQGGILSGPGATQNVPLYHDCQRFADSTGKYGELFAVFATRRVAGIGTLSRDNAVPVAEIVAMADYAPLNIREGFNCVYLYSPEGSARAAKIVSFGSNEGNCLADKAVASMAGASDLEVKTNTAPSFTPTDADVPPVARWDWDEANRQYYFGTKCGADWCEIGAARFVSSPSAFQRLPSADAASMLPHAARRRRYAFKGWYDEQLLAVTSSGNTVPSMIRGTIIPDPALDTLTLGGVTRKWVQVAEILLDVPAGVENPYVHKLNLAHTRPGAQPNRIELCHSTGPVSECLEPGATQPVCSTAYANAAMGKTQQWIARITNSDGRVAYRCVLAHAPPGGTAVNDHPRTARWHWLDSDEIIWEWCPSGCCEEWSES